MMSEYHKLSCLHLFKRFLSLYCRDKAFNDWKGYMGKETNGTERNIDRDSPASLTPSGRMIAEIPTTAREADL